MACGRLERKARDSADARRCDRTSCLYERLLPTSIAAEVVRCLGMLQELRDSAVMRVVNVEARAAFASQNVRRHRKCTAC